MPPLSMQLVPINIASTPPDAMARLWPWIITDTRASWWACTSPPAPLVFLDVAHAVADAPAPPDIPTWVSPRLARRRRMLTLDITDNDVIFEGADYDRVPIVLDWCPTFFAARAQRYPYGVLQLDDYAASTREMWLEGALRYYAGVHLPDAGIGRGSGEIAYRFHTSNKPAYWRDQRVGVIAFQGQRGIEYRMTPP